MGDMQEKIKEFAQDVPLLVEAGFIAVKQIDEDSARKCFFAAMTIDPELSLPVVGIGMIHLMKLDLDEATEMFNVVLQKEPENEMAKTMLGIVNLYRVNKEGLKKGKELIEEAMDKSDDPELQQLGKYSHDLYKEIKHKMKDLHPLETNKKIPTKKRLKD